MDVEFQEELENKRHEELLSVLSTIADKLKKDDDIKLYSLLIAEMRKITSTLEKTSKLDTTTDEIKKLSSVWVKAVDKLKPLSSNEWHFDINRDSRGYISSVDATKIQ